MPNNRLLALTVSLVMLLGLLTSGLAMASFPDVPAGMEEAVQFLNETRILRGWDGMFHPDGDFTREQLATVVVRMLDADDEAEASHGQRPSMYADAQPAGHWSNGYLIVAYNMELMRGWADLDGQRVFDPLGVVSFDETIAIVLRALGHEPLTGADWRQLNRALALEVGLITPEIADRGEDLATRGEIAGIVYSGMVDVPHATTGRYLADAFDQEEPGDDHAVESLNISLELSPSLVPEGGGQTVTISIHVTDHVGTSVEGALVDLNAEAFEAGSRNNQLSPSNTSTDSSGRTQVVYTTRGEDDHRFITVNVAASKDDLMEHAQIQFVAANQAATVSGVLRDPFTGVPVAGVPIHFVPANMDGSIGFVETAADGSYSATLPVGQYSLSPDIQPRDSITVNMSTAGASYTVDFNKGVLKGVVTGVSPGSQVMAIGPGFNPNNRDNWTLQAVVESDGSFVLLLFANTYEIYIVGEWSPFKTGVSVQSGQVTDLGTVKAD